jgi:hypothetical protein
MTGGEFPEGWTDDRRRAFREALRARGERQARAGQAFALALGVVVAGGILLRLPEAWWVPAVGAIALAGLVFRMVNWKCPACGERLPTRRGQRCRSCGAPLEE